MKANECKYCKETRMQLETCRQILMLCRKALKETKLRWQAAEFKVLELQCPSYCAREADARANAARECAEIADKMSGGFRHTWVADEIRKKFCLPEPE